MGSRLRFATHGQENSHLAQLQSLSSQLGGAKEAGEGAGAEGSPAGLAHAIPPGTMPFVPSPETLLLLLRSFASEWDSELWLGIRILGCCLVARVVSCIQLFAA